MFPPAVLYSFLSLKAQCVHVCVCLSLAPNRPSKLKVFFKDENNTSKGKVFFVCYL